MTGSYKDKTQIYVKNRTHRSVCESVNGHPLGNGIGQTWLDGDIMTFVSDENIRHPQVRVNGLTHIPPPPPFSLSLPVFFSLNNGRHCFCIQTEDLIGLSL